MNNLRKLLKYIPSFVLIFSLIEGITYYINKKYFTGYDLKLYDKLYHWIYEPNEGYKWLFYSTLVSFALIFVMIIIVINIIKKKREYQYIIVNLITLGIYIIISFNIPSILSNSNIYVAIALGKEKQAVKLLEKKDYSNEYNKLLISSLNSYYENANITELLLKKGANPNIYDDFGNTTLLTAAFFCKKKELLLLLSYGAKIDLKDKNGRDIYRFIDENGILYNKKKTEIEEILKGNSK